MAHSAEIIAVGTEILLGNIANTDAQFLSQSDACWQENIDWMLEQGLISSAPSLDDVRVNLDF